MNDICCGARAPALEASLPPRPPWLHCPYRHRASVARSVARVCATGCAVSSCVSRTRELPFLGRLSVRACRRRISSRVAAWSVPRRSSPPQRPCASGARLARTDYHPTSTLGKCGTLLTLTSGLVLAIGEGGAQLYDGDSNTWISICGCGELGGVDVGAATFFLGNSESGVALP